MKADYSGILNRFAGPSRLHATLKRVCVAGCAVAFVIILLTTATEHRWYYSAPRSPDEIRGMTFGVRVYVRIHRSDLPDSHVVYVSAGDHLLFELARHAVSFAGLAALPGFVVFLADAIRRHQRLASERAKKDA